MESNKAWEDLKCELCQEQATRFVRDVARVDKITDCYKKYEPFGKLHMFCENHARESEEIDLRTPLLDAIEEEWVLISYSRKQGNYKKMIRTQELPGTACDKCGTRERPVKMYGLTMLCKECREEGEEHETTETSD